MTSQRMLRKHEFLSLAGFGWSGMLGCLLDPGTLSPSLLDEMLVKQATHNLWHSRSILPDSCARSQESKTVLTNEDLSVSIEEQLTLIPSSSPQKSTRAWDNTTLVWSVRENPNYLSRQLLTYIGNKRSLLGQIGNAVAWVKQRLGKKHLRIMDAFSGSGVVSRFMKAHSSLLISNDIEAYAAVINRCYLGNRNQLNLKEIAQVISEINDLVKMNYFSKGFIEELYSP